MKCLDDDDALFYVVFVALALYVWWMFAWK